MPKAPTDRQWVKMIGELRVACENGVKCYALAAILVWINNQRHNDMFFILAFLCCIFGGLRFLCVFLFPWVKDRLQQQYPWLQGRDRLYRFLVLVLILPGQCVFLTWMAYMTWHA